jgi:hypothetical protein
MMEYAGPGTLCSLTEVIASRRQTCNTFWW